MNEEKKEFDTDMTEFPICPYCGHEDIDWWDGTTLNNDGDIEHTFCPSCGEEYQVTMHVSTRFTTESK